jgi:hypothetical protein
MGRDLGYWKEMAAWCDGAQTSAGKETNTNE